MRDEALEVDVEREELRPRSNGLGGNQRGYSADGDTAGAAGVRNPRGGDVVFERGHEWWESGEYVVETLKVSRSSNAGEQLLGHHAGHREWEIVPDHAAKSNDCRHGGGASPSGAAKCQREY